MFSDALKRRQKLLHIIGDSFDNDINDAIKLVTNTVKDERFLFFVGNGGSAAEAQHMSAEYIATLDHRNYRKGIKALALTVDTSFITAWTNDFEYETIFSRQLETLGAPNDLLFAYSTSGNSKNIIKVIEYASKNRIKIIGFTGNNGGAMNEICDVNFVVPSSNTAMIQEVHTMLGHVICGFVEKGIVSNE